MTYQGKLNKDVDVLVQFGKLVRKIFYPSGSIVEVEIAPDAKGWLVRQPYNEIWVQVEDDVVSFE